MEYLTAGEARVRLGISRNKMAKLLADGTLPSKTHPLDARKRLIPLEDIERLERQIAELEGEAP